MVNKLRELAIAIIEEIEEHVDKCENGKPFDDENWYQIEDATHDRLHKYLVGDEE